MCGLPCNDTKVGPVIGDEHNVSYKTPGYDVCLDTYGCQENEFPITRSSPRSEGSHTKARNEEKLAYQTEHPIRILRVEQRHGHDPKYGRCRQKYQQECDGSSQLGHLLNLTFAPTGACTRCINNVRRFPRVRVGRGVRRHLSRDRLLFVALDCDGIANLDRHEILSNH